MSILAATSELTINDVEKTVQDGLEALRNAPLNDQIVDALKYLVPQGYRPVAQLEEDGRKKRSNAAASNWDPATGEIVIYFERFQPSTPPRTSYASRDALTQSNSAELPQLIPKPVVKNPVVKNEETQYADQPSPRMEVSDLQLQQCCETLAESEKAGRSFIALKWFRDTALVASGYPWAESLAFRQAVVTKAIEAGAFITSSIPNPKAPQHPTTTVTLNRDSEYAQTVTRRFQPIRPRGGESASEAILRDRGRL